MTATVSVRVQPCSHIRHCIEDFCPNGNTGMGARVGPRMRESYLLTPFGHKGGGQVHATQDPLFRPSKYMTGEKSHDVAKPAQTIFATLELSLRQILPNDWEQNRGEYTKLHM